MLRFRYMSNRIRRQCLLATKSRLHSDYEDSDASLQERGGLEQGIFRKTQDCRTMVAQALTWHKLALLLRGGKYMPLGPWM